MTFKKRFIAFCEEWGTLNSRTSPLEVHYTLPISDATSKTLEILFLYAKVTPIYTLDKEVGIRYERQGCVWEEYENEYDCSYARMTGLKDAIIAFIPRINGFQPQVSV